MTSRGSDHTPESGSEKLADETGNVQRENGPENSQNASTEISVGLASEKLANDGGTISHIESTRSAVFDPAARAPINVSRESGIIGMLAIFGSHRFSLTLIGWEGENDPSNPRNWALWRKGVVVAIVSAITFFSPLASSMFAPGIPSVLNAFHTTNESLGTFCVSVYVLVCCPLLEKLICRVLLQVHYCGRQCPKCMVAPPFLILPTFFSLYLPSPVDSPIAWLLLLFSDSLLDSAGAHVLRLVAVSSPT
jgi:hypothetical protein